MNPIMKEQLVKQGLADKYPSRISRCARYYETPRSGALFRMDGAKSFDQGGSRISTNKTVFWCWINFSRRRKLPSGGRN